jgi:hypothetical protein
MQRRLAATYQSRETQLATSENAVVSIDIAHSEVVQDFATSTVVCTAGWLSSHIASQHE